MDSDILLMQLSLADLMGRRASSLPRSGATAGVFLELKWQL